MRRIRPVAVLTITALVAVLVLPATAFGVLSNQYGMKYTGQATCISCHDTSYGDTTHGDFAQVGADPSDDYMWPAGRPSVGELVEKDEIAFTLGAGTGLREYLAINPAGGGGTNVTPINFIEVQGTDRYSTAVEASKKAFAGGADAVVVATGENYPDALGGAALAGAVDGPILLTKKAAVRADVLAEIERLNPSKIYLLGSADSVSAEAEAQLADIADVTRISGDNRYATASLVASEVISLLGGGYSGNAFVVTGAGYADALAAAPIAFKKGMPILLASKSGVSVPAGVTDAVILGNTGTVSQAIEDVLAGDLDSVDRIAGGDRYDTAAQVAAYGVSLGMSWDKVGVATGESFPDALAGGPLVGSMNSVLLLTKSASLSPYCAAALDANADDIFTLHFVGGATSTTCRNAVKEAVPSHVVILPGDPNPFVVPAMEWDPSEPDVWEIGSTGIEFETYTCNPCHHLGAVSKDKKPTVGTFVSTSTTGTANAWVTPEGTTLGSPEKYAAGASIQCEVCHGTGQAGPGVANHFNQFTDYVKIQRGTAMLDSQMCGQCHGTAKSKSMFGYTPDQNINLFATWFKLTDVPTEASFTVNPSGYKFYPNGENKGNKHSYYTEWTMSAHSYRGAITKTDARASVFQAAGNGHYNATTSSLDCAKCHTGEGYAKRKSLKIMQNITLTNSNVGFYGQECATCHVPHNAGTDNGLGVRQPDAATTLAGITMTSICEDCHNWQLEMQNASIPTTFATPAKDLTARGGFSHPTREIYNGRGMFDVAAADKFMPGVKCEECHMPATRSDFPDKTGLTRYESRSYKRYSHRMFIMEPGKAADWGLGPWGDSCSPCHAGETQDQLQANIEKWQDDAAEAASEASAAYAAAYAAAPGSGENTGSVQFKALMGRAYYNYRNYLGEGSLGAHNPEYIVAGLEKATQLAKSVNGYFDVFTGGTAYPGLDYVMGTVHNGDDSAAANAKIVITVNGADQTVYTDANGNFTLTFAAGGSGVTNVKWQRCSDSVADLTPIF